MPPQLDGREPSPQELVQLDGRKASSLQHVQLDGGELQPDQPAHVWLLGFFMNEILS